MTMSTALLREMDVHVDCVRPQGLRSASPEYVFALRPRAADIPHSQHSRPQRQDVEHVVRPRRDAVPVAHEVARSYSECRALYRLLRQLTDCKDVEACCCALGSCPFWSLFAVLGAVEFPKKTLFNHQSAHVFASRSQALDAFLHTVLKALRTNYRPRHFRTYKAPYTGAAVCKVLSSLGRFFELQDADVQHRLVTGSELLAGKMNLRGWKSDRPNLYFHSEDKEKYRDAHGGGHRKSVEMAPRPSLVPSEDDKDPSEASEAEAEAETQCRNSRCLGRS